MQRLSGQSMKQQASPQTKLPTLYLFSPNTSVVVQLARSTSRLLYALLPDFDSQVSKNDQKTVRVDAIMMNERVALSCPEPPSQATFPCLRHTRPILSLSLPERLASSARHQRLRVITLTYNVKSCFEVVFAFFRRHRWLDLAGIMPQPFVNGHLSGREGKSKHGNRITKCQYSGETHGAASTGHPAVLLSYCLALRLSPNPREAPRNRQWPSHRADVQKAIT